MKRLEKKHTIVTGGGSGIGRAIALRFAEEGAIVSVFERDADAAAKTIDEISRNGGVAHSFSVDVSSMESVQRAIESIDVVDIMVNNAGVSSIGNIEETSGDEMDRLYSINVKGVYHCMQAVMPHFRSQGRGIILNMASIASKVGVKDRFAYSMSKGAVYAMTLSAARDYVEQGIRCNCLCPARVHTPFVDAFLDKHYPDTKEEMRAELSAYQPIGRMGKPEEIASLALFLCSEEAALITGVAYDIDGGVIQLR